MKKVAGKYIGICGLQHIGVGVSNHEQSWHWYRKYFSMHVSLFNAEALAPMMAIYTNGSPVNKRAAMLLNLQGGYALETVQLLYPPPVSSAFEVQLGDLGIFMAHIKAPNIHRAYRLHQAENTHLLGHLDKAPDGTLAFYLRDPTGNVFQVLQGEDWFLDNGRVSGGPRGCTIGVSDMGRSLQFYGAIMGYGDVIYDESGVFDDWNYLPGGKHRFRRVLLGKTHPMLGGFADLVGRGFIELVQVLDRQPRSIYEDRIWGDPGFVHLGFEVKGMVELGKELTALGFPFSCDSANVLDMGNTRVHCTYIEDPDGTLIELVELYKIPIIARLGWFLNVEKRDPLKPFPRILVKALRFGTSPLG